MSPSLHPLADSFIASRLETPSERASREKSATEQLLLTIALSSLPLIGLAAGVVSVALWTAA